MQVHAQTVHDNPMKLLTNLIYSVLLYAHRSHRAYKGLEGQGVHFDFHTAPDLCDESQYFFHPDITALVDWA